MEFDRKGPEGGLEIYTSIENGKALLEFKVYLQKAMSEELLEENDAPSEQYNEAFLEIRMWDREDRLVLYGSYPLCQEEPAKGLILHPHLWQGTEEPYLYRIQVSLMEKTYYVADRIDTTIALRSFREIPRKGWYLNDRPFGIRAVAYEIPSRMCLGSIINEKAGREHIRRDLELINRMGANTICVVGGEIDREFCRSCDEVGLLLWCVGKQDSADPVADIPRFYGTEDSLLTLRGSSLTDRYYYYKACWSKDPFVYISTQSIAYQKNGNVRVTVYSNQKKVALYVDGILFEFKTDGPDFLFEEIPVKKQPLMLTAEAGECSMSVTATTFT